MRILFQSEKDKLVLIAQTIEDWSLSFRGLDARCRFSRVFSQERQLLWLIWLFCAQSPYCKDTRLGANSFLIEQTDFQKGIKNHLIRVSSFESVSTIWFTEFCTRLCLIWGFVMLTSPSIQLMYILMLLRNIEWKLGERCWSWGGNDSGTCTLSSVVSRSDRFLDLFLFLFLPSLLFGIEWLYFGIFSSITCINRFLFKSALLVSIRYTVYVMCTPTPSHFLSKHLVKLVVCLKERFLTLRIILLLRGGALLYALYRLPHPGIYVTTKTGLCKFDPLKPNFYTVKLGFTGVFFLFLLAHIYTR